MRDNSWSQVILCQDPRTAATVGLLMDMAHKVLGSGSEHGPVVDLWELEDPYVPNQMRVCHQQSGMVGGYQTATPSTTPFLLSCEFGAKLQSGYDLISQLMTQILPVRMGVTLRHVTPSFVSY